MRPLETAPSHHAGAHKDCLVRVVAGWRRAAAARMPELCCGLGGVGSSCTAQRAWLAHVRSALQVVMVGDPSAAAEAAADLFAPGRPRLGHIARRCRGPRVSAGPRARRACVANVGSADAQLVRASALCAHGHGWRCLWGPGASAVVGVCAAQRRGTRQRSEA